MKTRFALSLMLLIYSCALSRAADWITSPSRFTHDPRTGNRTTQFAPIPPVYHTPANGRSAYRHARSSLQVGDSIDQYHVTEEYGNQVRPYGEWRFPYRPFSTPYHVWGPPPGHGGIGYGGFGGFGVGVGNEIGSPFGPYGVINGSGFPQAWADGSYPDVLRQQLPPQPFAIPGISNSTSTTNINGNANQAASPNNTVTGNNNAVNNNQAGAVAPLNVVVPNAAVVPAPTNINGNNNNLNSPTNTVQGNNNNVNN